MSVAGATTDGQRTLLIIGGKEEHLRKARGLGLAVVYVQQKDKFSESHLDLVEHAVLTDRTDAETLIGLAKVLKNILTFDHAFSLEEYGLVPAAVINSTPGTSGGALETARLLKDKLAMRQRLNASGLGTVAAEPVRTKQAAVRFARAHGLPMVLKPADTSGSYSVFKVDTLNDMDSAWQQLVDRQLQSRAMAEEYLEGPEISVEAFSYDARHVVIAITDKLTLPNFVEIGHSMPSGIDAELQGRVVRLVNDFLDAVGVKNGPSHTEVKLTPEGPIILESHNRGGGDRITELVRLVYDFDIEVEAMAVPFGLATRPSQPPTPSGGAAIRYLTPAPGNVREICGIDEAQKAEEIVELQLRVGVGDRVHPIRRSRNRVAWLIAVGENAGEAVAACDRWSDRVRIVTS